MKKAASYSNILMFLFLSILFQPTLSQAKCTCETEYKDQDRTEAFKYKLIAIASILISSALGISLPLLLQKNISALQPNSGPHFLIKAFAAGVILATGFIHILPDAFDSLSSPCLENPWGDFPFAGLIAMSSAIGTLMMEAFATGYHKRAELRKARPVVSGDEESDGGGGNRAGALVLQRSDSSQLIRNRVISLVLEMGIVVHSVVIGMSMGATQSPKTIKPLIAALSFHQFFEGMGLGGCISQAKYKKGAITIMILLFFSLTTPTGIGIGIGISNIYNEYSPTALIVEGVLNSASAGILIYMALVDLLASDFMNPNLQINFRLQLGSNVALLIGACSMSILAKWGGA
ncbi:hypothetical protein C3L33_07741, partial [Rhododendron williamsianum]